MKKKVKSAPKTQTQELDRLPHWSRPLVLLLVVQALLFALLQIPEPVTKLELAWPQFLHLGLWLCWVRARKPWKAWWRPWVLAFAVSQVVFLFAHYYLRGSASLVYLAGGLVPLAVWGLIRFVQWNAKCARDAQAVRALGMSALAWGLVAAAYPPLPLGPGGLVFLAPWFLVLWRVPMRAALFASFWSGFLFYALNYYWIYNVVKVGPGPVIMMGLFLLISYFAVYNTIAGWAFVKARELRWKGVPVLVALYPLFWAGLEVTRTLGDFSFPWSPLGMIFGQQVEWLQGLAWVGVYGYSALVVLANMGLAYALLRRRFAFAALPVLVLAVLWGHGVWVLSAPQAQPFHIAPGSDSLRVAMVQPSIHQTKKWSNRYFDTVMTKTWHVADSVDQRDLDLLVLPETAIPDFIRLRPSIRRRLENQVDSTGVPIFIGALNYDLQGTAPRRRRYFNSGFLFDKGHATTEYRKVHLVPFSERLPFDDVFPLLNYVDLGEGDFSPGDTLPVMQPGGWTPLICYEAIYGDITRAAVRNGAKLLVNITNDGWFGRSTAPGQHLNLVRYRAIETGVPVARCANSGISTFIDARGHLAETTDLFTERVIRKTMSLQTIPTLYFRVGDLVERGLLILFALWWVALAIWKWAMRRADKK